MTNQILTFLKSRTLLIARISYVVFSLALIGYLIIDRQRVKEPPPVVQVVTEDPNLKKFEKIDSELKAQLQLIKQLETKKEEIIATNKVLEKRLQGQLEFNKRLCEYIIVITVDKKIVPRQCLPDFVWKDS